MSEPALPVAELHPRPLAALSGHLQALVRGRLWLQVLIGMVLGLAVGVAIGPSAGLVAADAADTIAAWLAFPGRLFLALVQMIVIPLVFASIIRGLAASESVDQLRRMGVRVVLYFICTMTTAITIGLVAVTVIEPGRYIDSALVQNALGGAQAAPAAAAETALPTLAEMPRRLVTLLPANPLNAMVQAEMLGIIIFAAIVGVALVMMPPVQSKPLLDLLGSVQQVCMTVVRWAMKLAPYAVFGLMAQLTAKIGVDALLGMAVYVVTVLVGQFVIPLGATINMDGTALYQGVAALFLAQVFGVDVGLGGMLLVVLTAVGASIGTPGTPGVGIVILAMVLTTINVPPAGIALIMGVDRILDMSRTVINVNGDLTASVVMDRWVGGARSFEEERALQARQARERERTGEDILIGS